MIMTSDVVETSAKKIVEKVSFIKGIPKSFPLLNNLKNS